MGPSVSGERQAADRVVADPRLPLDAPPPPDITARATAAYLGLALGDALGATVEFMTPREIASQYGLHAHIRGGGWLRLRKGQVTDDTTMSLALGRAILEQGRVDAHAAALAFDAWMRAKPVDIGNTVRRGIVSFRQSGDPARKMDEHDAGNGAAMRVLPVALATLGHDEDAVRAQCRAQAHVTHHNPLSDAATECLALMVQDALMGLDKWELLHRHAEPLIARCPVFEYRQRRRENPSGYVVETMQAVFQALADTGNFRDCLVDVVNRGGDADTTGAIAGMVAGALYGLGALPAEWLAALDQEAMEACSRQAMDLMQLYGRPSHAGLQATEPPSWSSS
jgi:ADP-ribosyl-[dinitrogen reductase] hydrolase